jgi:hypothetical protein
MRGISALFAALLSTGSGAVALPVVTYTVDDLGGGLFQYDLLVDNDGGVALSGLNVLHGGSVFGLDGSSTIGAPAGWSSFAPLPPLIDDLVYFSLAEASDIPADGSLGGFSFQSQTDPDTLSGDDFAVEGIDAALATQIDLGVAMRVPEPALALLLAAGCLGARRARGRAA